MVRKQLMQTFIDEGNYIELSTKILKVGKNLLLIGETGVGKTLLAHNLANSLGNLQLFEKTMNENTSQWDLICSDTLEQGSTKVRDGVVVSWLKAKKAVLVINGLNYALANAASLFESLGDWTNKIWVPEYGQEFYRSPEHYLIATMNPHEKSAYTGTHQLNIATLRRFEGIEVHFLTAMRETELVMKYYSKYEWVRKLVEFANKTRILYRDGKLTFPITTGNLINYAGLKSLDATDAQILNVATVHYLSEERPTVRRMWEDTEALDVEALRKQDQKVK